MLPGVLSGLRDGLPSLACNGRTSIFAVVDRKLDNQSTDFDGGDHQSK